MSFYEILLMFAYLNGIKVKEFNFSSNAEGLYKDNAIAINKKLETQNEKTCVLAEELGHHFTTVGCIEKQENTSDKKQEIRARRWGYNKILSIENIITAYKAGCKNIYEMAEYLNITEEYLVSATEYFATKYREMIEIDDYIIKFSPLNIYTKNPLFHTC